MPTIRFFVMREEFRRRKRRRDRFNITLMQAALRYRLRESSYDYLIGYLETGEVPPEVLPADPAAFAAALKRGMETIEKRERYARKFFGDN